MHSPAFIAIMQVAGTVGLEPSLNPEYWELKSDAGELLNRWQVLDVGLSAYRVPVVPFFGAKGKLKKLFDPFAELQAETNRWLTRADSFFVKHPPGFVQGQDHVLTILWVQSEMNMLINSMLTRKYVAHYSFRGLMGALEQRQNFQIAIGSFVLAIIGLAASLVTILST